jgi:addiction module HigA family antidote
MPIPKHRKRAHLGEILAEDFLKPLGMSHADLASKMGVPVQRVTGLINNSRDLSAETAVLLARVLKTTPEFWMNLQANRLRAFKASLAEGVKYARGQKAKVKVERISVRVKTA